MRDARELIEYFEECGELSIRLNKVIAGKEIGKGYIAVLLLKAYLDEMLPEEKQRIAESMVRTLAVNAAHIEGGRLA